MRQHRWIVSGLKRAFHKSQHPHYKMSAMVIKGGRVISIGFNRAPSGYLKSKIFSTFHGIHAEVDAILSCADKEDLKGAEMYVVGRRPRTGALIISRPCVCCQQYIKSFGLKSVYYHDAEGFIRDLYSDDEDVAQICKKSFAPVITQSA